MVTVAAKIQGLRTTFREEVRKIKKSEHTGSGSADVYVPKWKFFNECMFLEDVVASNQPQCTNLQVGLLMGNEDDEDDILDKELHATETASTSSETSSEAAGAHPKRRKKSSEDNHWMETAANALTHMSNQEDVANSLRSLNNPDWQRRAKFAVQTAIFQVTEKARHPFSVSQVPIVSTAQVIEPLFSSMSN